MTIWRLAVSLAVSQYRDGQMHHAKGERRQCVSPGYQSPSQDAARIDGEESGHHPVPSVWFQTALWREFCELSSPRQVGRERVCVQILQIT
jgi:hypothetical protein